MPAPNSDKPAARPPIPPPMTAMELSLTVVIMGESRYKSQMGFPPFDGKKRTTGNERKEEENS
jgi:hypothetical protein